MSTWYGNADSHNLLAVNFAVVDDGANASLQNFEHFVGNRNAYLYGCYGGYELVVEVGYGHTHSKSLYAHYYAVGVAGVERVGVGAAPSAGGGLSCYYQQLPVYQLLHCLAKGRDGVVDIFAQLRNG